MREHDNANLDYATMTLTVRDYENALKAYAMDAADRKSAGLTDLAVLQPNAISGGAEGTRAA